MVNPRPSLEFQSSPQHAHPPARLDQAVQAGFPVRSPGRAQDLRDEEYRRLAHCQDLQRGGSGEGFQEARARWKQWGHGYLR